MSSDPPGGPDRLAGPGSVIAALLVVSLTVHGAISIVSHSTVQVATTSPPAHFEKGSNADDKRWFKSFELSTNKTSFTAEVKPRSGAYTYIQDVADLTSTDDASRTVTLTGSHISNTKVETFRWQVYDGIQRQATLDHKDADPSTSFTLPANGAYRLDLEIDLQDGAGNVNAGIEFQVQLEVT